MRHRPAAAALLVVACAAVGPAADDVRHWPLREINFPVPVERLQNGSQKPTKLRFHVRPDGQAWREAAASAPDALELIDREANKRGFRYTSPADGAYDFCLQVEYANGDKQPKDADLSPQYRVVFDTKPPVIDISRLGATGVDWKVSDENIRPDSVQIQARWVGESTFVAVNPKGFRPNLRDTYTWTDLKPGEQVDIRVMAIDKANNTHHSQVVRLPGTGSGGERLGGGGGGVTGPLVGEGGGAGSGGAADRAPSIEYSASKVLTITSKVEKVTRSGVSKSHLWVRTESTDWKKDREQPEAITSDQKDKKPTITWTHQVAADGRYGFIVIPENGAGGRDSDPLRADPAQFLIEVDTTPPKVLDVAAAARPGPNGPRVDITWKATDKNLPAEPVRIEYAETATAPTWTPVHPGTLPNSGRYSWDVPDDLKLWKFFIRVTATDLARLPGSAVTAQEVKVDLETPKAVIEKVTGGNGKGGSSALPGADADVRPTLGTTPPAPLPPPIYAPTPTPPVTKPTTPPVVKPPAGSPAPSGPVPATPPPALPKPPELPPEIGGRNPQGGPPTPVLPPPDTKKPGEGPSAGQVPLPGMPAPTLPGIPPVPVGVPVPGVGS